MSAVNRVRKTNDPMTIKTKTSPSVVEGRRQRPLLALLSAAGRLGGSGESFYERGFLGFLRRNANPDGSTLMTDEYAAYNAVDSTLNIKSSSTNSSMLTAKFIPTRLKGAGRCSSERHGSHYHYVAIVGNNDRYSLHLHLFYESGK